MQNPCKHKRKSFHATLISFLRGETRHFSLYVALYELKVIKYQVFYCQQKLPENEEKYRKGWQNLLEKPENEMSTIAQK